MRLLTEEECLATVGLRFNQLNTPYDIMGSDIADLLKAQRDLTHKETLKAAKEAINDYTHDKISFERLAELLEINLYELDAAFRKRGGMPEEVK